MSASDEELAQKIKYLKVLANKRVDEILKARTVSRQHQSGITFINTIFGRFKK